MARTESPEVFDAAVPSGVVALRATLVLLLATLLAGVSFGLMIRGGDATAADRPSIPESLAFGALVGLVAFVMLLVPVLLVTLLTRGRQASSPRFARVVAGAFVAVFTTALLLSMFIVLGKDFWQGLELAWPGLLLAAAITVWLAPWPTRARR